MNEISDKRVTVKTEIRLDPKAPKLKHQWNNREIDFDWFPIINKVIDNKSYYIEDITKTEQRQNAGLRLMYNTGYGKEFLLSEIDWIGDSYVILCIQREHQIKKLTFSQRAFINHRATELINLFSNAKYFLEGKE